MVTSPYARGDDVEAYVDAAIAAFEKDRAFHVEKQEVAFVVNQGGSEAEAIAFDLDADPPTLEDLASGRPLATFYFAHLLANLLLAAARELTDPYTSDPDGLDEGAWPELVAMITGHENGLTVRSTWKCLQNSMGHGALAKSGCRRPHARARAHCFGFGCCRVIDAVIANASK
jgi:hypothetical protein